MDNYRCLLCRWKGAADDLMIVSGSRPQDDEIFCPACGSPGIEVENEDSCTLCDRYPVQIPETGLCLGCYISITPRLDKERDELLSDE